MNLVITNDALYQLSYTSVAWRSTAQRIHYSECIQAWQVLFFIFRGFWRMFFHLLDNRLGLRCSSSMKQREDIGVKNMTSQTRMWLFVGLTFVVTYLYEFLVALPLMQSGTLEQFSAVLLSSVMLIPAACVLIVRLATGEGLKNAWIKPYFRQGRWKYYLFAWLAPVAAIIAGAAVYFLLFPAKFDPDMGYIAEQYAALGLPFDVKTVRSLAVMQVIAALFTSLLGNAVTCFGEEWGWRGYLLPKMLERFRVVPTVLLLGVIWGLWHAPLTINGHNYGMGYWGWPVLGILAMCAFCIVLNAIFTYITLKSRSCLPAVIAHGMVNGFASIALLYTRSAADTNPFVGPVPVGLVGGVGLILLAAVLLIKLWKDEKAGKLIAEPLPSKAQRAAAGEAAAAAAKEPGAENAAAMDGTKED